MLDTIKGLLRWIPGVGSPSRKNSNPVRSSTIIKPSSNTGAPNTSTRADLSNISRPVDAAVDMNLPVAKNEFETALEYMLKIKKDLSKIGEIPDQVKKIAVAMTKVSDNVADKMGLNKEQLEKISNTFSKQKINLLALFPIKDSLPKMIEFYAKTFNMTDKAMALA